MARYVPADRPCREDQIADLLDQRSCLVSAYRDGTVDVADRAAVVEAVRRIDALVDEVASERFRARSDTALGAIGLGVVIALAGLIVSGVTYAAAQGGGTYVVFWGAVVFGLWRVLTGSIALVTVRRQMRSFFGAV